MSASESITICEIFGPTIQGEGALIGLPTVFVRTGGCDYCCRWCDTLYAVDRRYRDQWTDMTVQEILAQVRLLGGEKPLMVSLSGGNPALQPLGDLLRTGRASGLSFALETQGSIAKSWFSDLAVLTLSPKPPSSGMQTDWQKLQDCIAAAGDAAVSLKLVVQDEADYQFAGEVAERCPQLPVYLQPCNVALGEDTDASGVAGYQANLERLHWLVARVLADGWYTARVLPQLHVLLWGNKRGR